MPSIAILKPADHQTGATRMRIRRIPLIRLTTRKRDEHEQRRHMRNKREKREKRSFAAELEDQQRKLSRLA